MGIKWEDRFQQLDGLGETQLLHLARNESASLDYRKTAVEIMRHKGFASVIHPELQRFWVVEADIPEPIEVAPEPETEDLGAFKASVTTATMYADDSVQKTDETLPPADEAPISEPQTIQENS